MHSNVMISNSVSLLSFSEWEDGQRFYYLLKSLVYVSTALLPLAVPHIDMALILSRAHLRDKVNWLQIDGGQLVVVGGPVGEVEQSRGSDAWYPPADTASWRLNMLTHGNLPDASFRQIR